jgi:tRNA 2-thiouridine synthesizing protein A
MMVAMALELLDTVGLKCPNPVLRLAVKAPDMKSGDILEISGDCPTFEKDIRIWCKRLGRTMLSLKEEEAGKKTIQIQL